MPFTFSHPAIVLPLKSVFGKWVSLTGVIVGSLIPDFEYFLRMKIQSEYSHTIIGTLWFSLPLGILLCFLFHNIIKNPLIENSPEFIQCRITVLSQLNWKEYFIKNWIIVCVSIIIGAYSHVFWDSFTHANAFFTNYFNLDRKILNSKISIFKLLQHLSTIIGGLVILFYFFKLKRMKKEYIKPNINYWMSISILTIIILGIRISLGLKITEYGNIIVSGITSGMIAITLTSLYFKLKRGAKKGYS